MLLILSKSVDKSCWKWFTQNRPISSGINTAHPVRDGRLSFYRCKNNYFNRRVDQRLPSTNGFLALAMRKNRPAYYFAI